MIHLAGTRVTKITVFVDDSLKLETSGHGLSPLASDSYNRDTVSNENFLWKSTEKTEHFISLDTVPSRCEI